MIALYLILVAFCIGGLLAYFEFQRSYKKLNKLENAFEKNKEAIKGGCK